jgi:hypothetical protein
MQHLPTQRQLLRARGLPMSDRHWRVVVELVAIATAPGMDLHHAEMLEEQAEAVLALSTARQGSEAIMPVPHADQLQRLGLR